MSNILDLRGTKIDVIMHTNTSFKMSLVFKDDDGNLIDMSGSDIELYFNSKKEADVGNGITIDGSDVDILIDNIPSIGKHTYHILVINGGVTEKIYGDLEVLSRTQKINVKNKC